MSAESKALRKLFDRLQAFKVTKWSANSDDNDATPDRATSTTADGDVVSSRLRFTANSLAGGKHMVVLDIDHEAWLVRSTTPGHYHLYIDVPEGIDWQKYGTMLLAMASAGVIEQGYAEASISRGYSAVRLPWVKKPAPDPVPGPPAWALPADLDDWGFAPKPGTMLPANATSSNHDSPMTLDINARRSGLADEIEGYKKQLIASLTGKGLSVTGRQSMKSFTSEPDSDDFDDLLDEA